MWGDMSKCGRPLQRMQESMQLSIFYFYCDEVIRAQISLCVKQQTFDCCEEIHYNMGVLQKLVHRMPLVIIEETKNVVVVFFVTIFIV